MGHSLIKGVAGSGFSFLFLIEKTCYISLFNSYKINSMLQHFYNCMVRIDKEVVKGLNI